MLSVETLFWAPLAMDLMLLVGTYSACNLKGLGWFLDEMKKHSIKKNDDDDDEVIAKLVKDKSHPIHSVWYIAMSAYSAYACVSRHVSIIVCRISVPLISSPFLSPQLLPWATYVAYTNPNLRVSLSWAMTAMMATKLASPNTWKWTNNTENGAKGKALTIIFFYIPTYGGYAAYKSFLPP